MQNCSLGLLPPSIVAGGNLQDFSLPKKISHRHAGNGPAPQSRAHFFLPASPERAPEIDPTTPASDRGRRPRGRERGCARHRAERRRRASRSAAAMPRAHPRWRQGFAQNAESRPTASKEVDPRGWMWVELWVRAAARTTSERFQRDAWRLGGYSLAAATRPPRRARGEASRRSGPGEEQQRDPHRRSQFGL